MNTAVLDAVQLALAGDTSIAHERLSELWSELPPEDLFNRCVVAHYMADLQPDPQTELDWDLRALDAALAASPASFENQLLNVTREAFLPSLYLNLASSYERTHDLDQAIRHAALAVAAVASLPSSPLAETTRQAIFRISDRLRRAAATSSLATD